MCLGCGIRKPKKELIRIVKNEAGTVTVDGVQKMNTRGAYVCGERSCMERVLKRKSLEKTLGVHIGEEQAQVLLNIIGNENG